MLCVDRNIPILGTCEYGNASEKTLKNELLGGVGNAHKNYHGDPIDSRTRLKLKNTVKRSLFISLLFAAVASLLTACSVLK